MSAAITKVPARNPMTMEEAFPDIDYPHEPFGTRVLVQIMRTVERTASGIFIPKEAQETEKVNQQIAKIVAMGPLAYRNRETKEAWPEGMWAQVGDIVRVPRWNGDRVDVEIRVGDMPTTEKVTFVTFADHEVVGKVRGNPLEANTYIL